MSNPSKKKNDMCMGMGMMGKGKENDCDEGKGGKGKGGMSKGMNHGKGKGKGGTTWDPTYPLTLEPTLAPSAFSVGKGKGKGKGKSGYYNYKKTAWFRSILNVTYQTKPPKSSDEENDVLRNNLNGSTIGRVWSNISHVAHAPTNRTQEATLGDVKLDEEDGARHRQRIQYHADR